MSKPNLLRFSTSVGFYRNKRLLDLECSLSKCLPGKIERSKLAPTFFQVTMAYAAENQIDGNFVGYTADHWSKIFVMNNLPVTPNEAASIVKCFRDVGLFEGDKIRSWLKYNRHLGDYEGLVRAKRLAGKLSAKKRQIEAREAVQKAPETDQKGAQNGEKTAQNSEKNVQKHVKKEGVKDGVSKQLWVVNEGLKTATGKRRRELAEKREQLISAAAGVDPNPPPPSPAPSSPPARKISAQEREAQHLQMAQITLADMPDALSESMVTALVKAGHKLPSAVKSRFRDLIAKLDNPVPE